MYVIITLNESWMSLILIVVKNLENSSLKVLHFSTEPPGNLHKLHNKYVLTSEQNVTVECKP